MLPSSAASGGGGPSRAASVVSVPGARRRRAGWLVALAFATGCAAGPDAAQEERPLRVAAFVGPTVGAGLEPGEAGDPGLETAEDALLEVVTTLSGERDLVAVLVAGPLVAPGLGVADPGAEPATPAGGDDDTGPARDEAIAGLLGGLGSIAAPVCVALAPGDPAGPLLEALRDGLPGHPGRAAHAHRPKQAWLDAVALGPAGEVPEPARSDEPGAQADAAPRARVVVTALPALGAREAPPGTLLLVLPGDAPALAVEAGVAVLRLPPLTRPPHLYALATVSRGEVRVALRALDPAATPPTLPPARLGTSAASPGP